MPGLHDILSAGLSFLDFGTIAGGGVFVHSFGPRTVERLSSLIPAGDSVSAELILTTNQAGDLVNTATSDSQTEHPDPSNNSSTFILTVKRHIDIDIKPGSYPNSANLRSKGVIAVTMLTTSEFDAATVEPETVSFAGALAASYASDHVDGDGDMDLVLHFRTAEPNLSPGDNEAVPSGVTCAGIELVGADSINVVC